MSRFGIGWRRLKRRMLRERMSVDAIAAGWALGMFIGCAVPFGVQLVISVPLAALFRISKIGATLGTLITNPVTIFFIYPLQCWFGSRIIGCPLSWGYLRGEVYENLCAVSLWSAEGWRVLSNLGARVVGGFVVGGLAIALVMTPITYFAVHRLVSRYRARRDSRERGKA